MQFYFDSLFKQKCWTIVRIWTDMLYTKWLIINIKNSKLTDDENNQSGHTLQTELETKESQCFSLWHQTSFKF